MEGYRKFIAWFITTMAMTVCFFYAVPKVPATDIASMFQMYVMVQGVLSGAWFGANFGEHWAKARGK